MWRFLSPALYSTLGYFPGIKLGMGQNLCKASIRQWKGWCLQKNYLMDDETLNIDNYREYRGRIIAYAISDDEWGGIDAVDSVISWYENADTTRINIFPTDYDLDRIGHNGLFRMKDGRIWDEIIDRIASLDD